VGSECGQCCQCQYDSEEQARASSQHVETPGKMISQYCKRKWAGSQGKLGASVPLLLRRTGGFSSAAVCLRRMGPDFPSLMLRPRVRRTNRAFTWSNSLVVGYS